MADDFDETLEEFYPEDNRQQSVHEPEAPLMNADDVLENAQRMNELLKHRTTSRSEERRQLID